MKNSPLSDFDAIVLGAGGAGLLLLQALHEDGWMKDNRILVVEPEAKQTNDRTWCYWSDGSDQLLQNLGDVVSHSWSMVNNGLGSVESLSPYTYSHIRSKDFYAKVMNTILPFVSWKNARAGEVYEKDGLCFVHIEDICLSARYIFDSRPFSPTELDAVMKSSDSLWQSFVGFRVKTEMPVHTEVCTLMDFNIEQDGASQFVYTLPTDEHEALIELTRFGTDILDKERAHQLLLKYIDLNYGKFQILETEYGRIPMTAALNPKLEFHAQETCYIQIGSRAGAVKSTTGYAFKKMSNHAQRIAKALTSAGQIPTAFHHPRLSFYDDLLLRVLTQRPDWGKNIFQRLFSKRRTADVLRFLDEETHLIQEAKILSALQPGPFLQALVSTRVKNLRNSISRIYKEAPTLLQTDGALVLLLTCMLVLCNVLMHDALVTASPWILLAGLIFPGIPHGAVDHWIALGAKIDWRKLLAFVVRYLAVMGAIGMLWWISPTVGFIFFLGYSAWHFGETDLQEWKSYKGILASLWGCAVLGTILFGHFSSLEPYMNSYGIYSLYTFLAPFQYLLLASSLAAVGITGVLLPKQAVKQWAITASVLLLGLFLPLLLSFALYFVGCHSFRGWKHLQTGLQSSPTSLLRKALPFSFGAWLIGVVALLAVTHAGLLINNLWAFGFAFIAAISAPHVWMMHIMYRKTSS